MSEVEDGCDEVNLRDELVSVAPLHELADVGDGDADQQVHHHDAEQEREHAHEQQGSP